MELEDTGPWAEAFTAFCTRFDDLFARRESREQMGKYLRGLVAPLALASVRQTSATQGADG